jgi:hypothetical protein
MGENLPESKETVNWRKRVRESEKFELYLPELAKMLGAIPRRHKLVYSVEDIKRVDNKTFTITIRVWDVYEIKRYGEGNN